MPGTGDNARWGRSDSLKCHCSGTCRHDNDDDIPRPLDEIYDLNRAVAKKMEHVFLSKGIPVVPSLGRFLAHLCIHFHERCIVYQGTMIYGVSVSNVLEHVTICLTTYIAHVSYFEYPGLSLLISATLLLEYIICRYGYCFSWSSVLIYSNQDLMRFSKSSPRMFPQTQSLSRS